MGMKEGVSKRKLLKRNPSVFLLIVGFMLLLSIALVLADNHTDEDIGPDTDAPIDIVDTGFGEEIDKAYTCLKSQLEDDCGDTLSTEQNIFSLLAMGYDSSTQSDCKQELEDKQKTDCWGKTRSDPCNIKSTAQAILAMDYIGEDVEDEKDWLLSNRRLAEDLNWYLEVDANEATTCKIKTNGENERTFNIGDDRKFSGSSSATCLTPAESNYYLRINSDCLGDNFTISCDQTFITTLWYKKPGDSTMYISSETHGSTSEGSTEEKVHAYCFSTSTSGCDYQGSLWAALVLGKLGEDTYPYIPYITAMSDETENKKYLPSAFLYGLTNEDDYYFQLVDEQKQDKYWEETTNEKFYDTALALLSLQNVNIEQVDNAKEWLLGVQESSGCWHANNILETAFLLFAGWPKDPVRVVGTGGGNDRSYCTDFSHYCTSVGECGLTDILENYYCSGINVCCKTEPLEQTCDEKDGIICDTNQKCTGTETTAYDTNYCCLASCQVESENQCEKENYFCKDFCSNSQDEKTVYTPDCSFGEVCCGEVSDPGSPWLLIILLIILIILVVLAIIFRNQLKIWFFRIKSKFKSSKGPKPSARFSMPPPGSMPQLRQRQIIPRHRGPVRRPVRRMQRRRSPAQKDKAFDDTMKKLRDMSK